MCPLISGTPLVGESLALGFVRISARTLQAFWKYFPLNHCFNSRRFPVEIRKHRKKAPPKVDFQVRHFGGVVIAGVDVGHAFRRRPNSGMASLQVPIFEEIRPF